MSECIAKKSFSSERASIMAKFLVTSDDNYKAFINIEQVCMFRFKKDSDGAPASPVEVEIEFLSDNKVKLHDKTAMNFLAAVSKLTS